jgi:NSS family neurotransmitter:Na+ symporter
MLADPASMTIWMVIAVVISLGVGLLGLQNGVEKITKILMLVLLALMVVLAINSLMLDGAMEGLKYYLYPDFSKIGDRGLGTVIFDALTHAFFTLSIGMGSMEIFGSYLKKDRTLFGESVSIVCVDTLVALTAGLIIIPSCFAYGIPCEGVGGPGLIFEALPAMFNHMAGGRIWGSLFFLFMIFAAMSTVVAVFENILSFGMELKGWSRRKSCIINLVAILILALPCALGFNVLAGFQPLGAGSCVLDLEDFIISNNILPLGSLVYVCFCAWKRRGWGWDNFIEEANAGDKGARFPRKMRVYCTYILPVILLALWVWGYVEKFLLPLLAKQ